MFLSGFDSNINSDTSYCLDPSTVLIYLDHNYDILKNSLKEDTEIPTLI